MTPPYQSPSAVHLSGAFVWPTKYWACEESKRSVGYLAGNCKLKRTWKGGGIEDGTGEGLNPSKLLWAAVSSDHFSVWRLEWFLDPLWLWFIWLAHSTSPHKSIWPMEWSTIPAFHPQNHVQLSMLCVNHLDTFWPIHTSWNGDRVLKNSQGVEKTFVSRTIAQLFRHSSIADTLAKLWQRLPAYMPSWRSQHHGKSGELFSIGQWQLSYHHNEHHILPHYQNNGEDCVPDFFVSTVGIIADGFQRPRFWQQLADSFVQLRNHGSISSPVCKPSNLFKRNGGAGPGHLTRRAFWVLFREVGCYFPQTVWPHCRTEGFLW